MNNNKKFAKIYDSLTIIDDIFVEWNYVIF